jgi:hypothetical protein
VKRIPGLFVFAGHVLDSRAVRGVAEQAQV